MTEYVLGTVESRFAKLIWEREPLSSGELVKLCEAELSWKKSTTYTVLKKLCDHGLFRNESGMVTSCVTKEEYYAVQGEQFLERSFGGSLPAFIAAFASHKALSREEVAEIQRMIDEFKEE